MCAIAWVYCGAYPLEYLRWTPLMSVSRYGSWSPGVALAIVTGVLCNGIACQDCGTVTGADVVALLGRASSFMAEVGYIRTQASEPPSV